MNPLLVVVIGVVLFGAVAFTAISNNQTKTTPTSPDKTYSDYTEADDPTADGLSRSLQLETFTPNLSNNSTTTNTTAACIPGGKTAYNFLLDTSSSMTAANDGRFPEMKKDVVAFISKLPPDAVVAVQAFDNGPREVVAPTYFKDIDSKYSGKINALKPTDATAGTNTSAGLAGSKKVIDANKSKFPGYNWSLILVTDGCPNSIDQPSTGLNIAKQIRDDGVALIGYGIKLGTAGKCGSLAKRLGLPTGTKPIEAAKVLMEKITGGKENYSLTETETLTSFLGKAPTKTCPASQPQACTPEPKQAFNFLLDTSGSMLKDDKLKQLKIASINFVSKLRGDDLIAIQDFSDEVTPRSESARSVLEFSPVSQSGSGFSSLLDKRLTLDGYTKLREGFELARQKIDEAKKSYTDYKFRLIFVSDGEPRSDEKEGGIDSDQFPDAISKQLQGEGVEVIGIAIQPKNDTAKQRVKSWSSRYFEASTADQLTSVYNQILSNVACIN